MLAARELLQRYPALRQSWPVQKLREIREERQWRNNPRHMASWFRDMPNMHTRLCVSNLVMPEAPELCRETSLVVSLVDGDGAPVGKQRFRLGVNASLFVDLADLLPKERRGQLPSGQVSIDFEGPHLGSSRAYLHWFNDNSLTSSHEKYGMTIPAVGGYWTVPSIHHADDYKISLAVVNLDSHPYVSRVSLRNVNGEEITTDVTLPALGSRFLSLEELFADPNAFLQNGSSILYFGNYEQPAMYYYFVENPKLGTWRAQHL